jgi:hypothetical protein
MRVQTRWGRVALMCGDGTGRDWRRPDTLPRRHFVLRAFLRESRSSAIVAFSLFS